MRVVIAGSRGLCCDDILREVMSSFTGITEVVSGMEPTGVDAAGLRWAEAKGIPVADFSPDWSKFTRRGDGYGGNPAGMARNEGMAVYGDFLVAIWDGKSPGTRDMIRRMRAKGKPVHIFTPSISRLVF